MGISIFLAGKVQNYLCHSVYFSLAAILWRRGKQSGRKEVLIDPDFSSFIF